MNQPVADHLVLPLEPFAAFGARAVWLRAIMRPVLGVHIGVRAGTLISPKKDQAMTAMWKTHLRRYCVWNGAALHPLYSHLKPPFASGNGPPAGKGGKVIGRGVSMLIRSPLGDVSVL